jgi:DNA polymerase I
VSWPFREVWGVDFEFHAPPGHRPRPICLVARELNTRRLERRWLWEEPAAPPPYPTDPGALFVAYYASADLGCHLALGWPLPARVLDLYAEFSRRTSGLAVPNGRRLLGALSYHGLDALAAVEKREMQGLAMRGGPFTPSERAALLDYCQSDVDALAGLLPAMAPEIDLPRALLRGRYMAAAARMEWNGVPIDTATLARLRANWDHIQDRLIARIDAGYGVFEGRSFRADRFGAYLARAGIPWPTLPSGQLALDDDTFREMARTYPAQIAPLREVRDSLSKLRLNNLAVGPDGRNRVLLSAFASKTGRNQPSNSSFIFGPSAWLRGLIKPGPGRAVAYLDWEQQEFGIAAALSGDTAMMEAYRSGDPYLAFAKQAGAVPPEATKDTHGPQRELFKACVLAVQYGMGEVSLAQRIGKPVAYARQLLALHRQTYPTYWAWSEAAVNRAMLHGRLHTAFGWQVHVGPDANPRSLANFPMQANGAEMLRLASSEATEGGVQVCAPVHDALLVEGPADQIEEVVGQTQAAMRKASEVVLAGFPLRTEAKVVAYPGRYMDKRGRVMWDTVQDLLPQGGGRCNGP